MPGAFLIFAFMGALALSVQHLAATQTSTIGVDQANYVGKYKTFLFYADQYMKANPTASGPIYWATIKTVGPAGVQATVFPSDWRIVATGTGSYVTCTSFPDNYTASGINLPLANRPEKVTPSSGYLVVGDPSNPSALATEAVKCD